MARHWRKNVEKLKERRRRGGRAAGAKILARRGGLPYCEHPELRGRSACRRKDRPDNRCARRSGTTPPCQR